MQTSHSEGWYAFLASTGILAPLRLRTSLSRGNGAQTRSLVGNSSRKIAG
jgi:hypothetical protein